MTFFEFASAACSKKRLAKNQASQQMFGCSYFVSALDITDFTVPKNIEINGSKTLMITHR
jgi:hypothetical protein